MYIPPTSPIADLAARVCDVYLSVPADRDPMRDVDERDLLRFARAATSARPSPPAHPATRRATTFLRAVRP